MNLILEGSVSSFFYWIFLFPLTFLITPGVVYKNTLTFLYNRRLTILEEDSILSFGGTFVNNTSTQNIYIGVSNLILGMHRYEKQFFSEEEYFAIKELKDKYHEYDSKIEGKSYYQTGIEERVLSKNDYGYFDLVLLMVVLLL